MTREKMYAQRQLRNLGEIQTLSDSMSCSEIQVLSTGSSSNSLASTAEHRE